MKQIITLATDFGIKDSYAGIMKGVILSINPDAKILDITHLVSHQNIFEGAIVISEAYKYFPKGTIHIGIVDPGVGSKRKPILIETDRYFFIGPDNGLFSLALKKERIKKAVHLTNKKYFLKDVSSTFHGRDIFAPVAAHLSLGKKPDSFGKPLNTRPQLIDMPEPIKKRGSIIGEVIYIDSFGNLIIIKRIRIKGISKTYVDGKKGLPIAVIGSSGNLEIACYADSASEILQIKQGEKVEVDIIQNLW
ncbi:MAG: SAM-dependent chlorinase/fluorinase [Deltaproteobacteria bacterium]|nr:SAM-dependent chlorinase/fluorinase [Deltaproteobacteria bacterium]